MRGVPGTKTPMAPFPTLTRSHPLAPSPVKGEGRVAAREAAE
jgi:hypothetical protein